MKKIIWLLIITILILSLLVLCSCSSARDYNTYSYGKVIHSDSERIVGEFEIVQSGEKVVNAFTNLEGENTGYVKLVYITKEEYDSLTKIPYERRKWKKTKNE